MSGQQSSELRKALSLPHVVELGKAPQFSLVARDEDAPPDQWMLVLSAPHPRRHWVRVLSAAANGRSRVEVEYPANIVVDVVATPAALGLSMLYDREVRAAYRTMTDWQALIEWRSNPRLQEPYCINCTEADPISSPAPESEQPE